MLFFFFSSRRRHTRWTGDWSSDVCSSDLAPGWSVAALKAEPDAPDRGDVPGAVRVVAELAAQPGNVHVERLGRGPPLRVPDLAHDLLPGDHLARVAQQDPEQVEFLGGQVELDQ